MRKALLGLSGLCTAGFCFLAPAYAATVILTSGQKIEGQILEQTELRVTVDVQGRPKTFFLGEIASIDGQQPQMPAPAAKPAQALPVQTTEAVPADIKKTDLPHYKDEHDSLERFMEKRSPAAVPAVTPAPPAPPVPEPKKTEDLHPGGNGFGGKAAEANKKVVTTSDGGFVVVGSKSIVKYDKDLNMIKKIDLDSNT